MSMYGLDEIKNSKGMHMAHINVRSLMSKWEHFKTTFKNSNLHVLGVSETWLNGNLTNQLFELSSNYIFYRNDRSWTDDNNATIKKGGGVGLFMNSDILSSDTDYAHLN